MANEVQNRTAIERESTRIGCRGWWISFAQYTEDVEAYQKAADKVSNWSDEGDCEMTDQYVIVHFVCRRIGNDLEVRGHVEHDH